MRPHESRFDTNWDGAERSRVFVYYRSRIVRKQPVASCALPIPDDQFWVNVFTEKKSTSS
jgi:hypothetical protein